ncbi:hypothetical protein [Sulfuritalea sp.]|uniref:hypothetical protein n=1 Tax=Sulfuritalea sp. TaxID=2480090 RepID=UPI001AC0DE33|nr:hypothetical protein [Sulfuritalea sp.]MBN8475593.1 hypothetical protein [Sulfuritalea sp.]
MHPNLSFDQAPPISVPYRFFLTAPWFGMLAGLLLAWSGGDGLGSRWTPEVLALTHLAGAGFMLQAMSGALFQFIPVAVGGNVWRPRLVANVIHPLLVLAALLLVAGLLFSNPALLSAAVPVFLLGAGGLVAAVALALWRTPATGMTLWSMRMAIGGLAITVLLGSLLADALARGLNLPLIDLTNVHLAWALGGWALMLLAGVSYHVVPMFQLTRPYPLWFARGFGPLLLLLLCAWSSRLLLDDDRWTTPIALPLLLLFSAYAVMTLWLQYTRRRKVDDATSLYFRVAMVSLLGFAVSGAAVRLYPPFGDDPRAIVWLGVLVFVGVFVSATAGMMYKITPFLNWLHLQRLGAPISAVPNMKKMIPADDMTGQLRLHVLALLLLLAAVWLPTLARLAGFAFAVSCAWLAWNLIGAARRYRMFTDQIRAVALHP